MKNKDFTAMGLLITVAIGIMLAAIIIPGIQHVFSLKQDEPTENVIEKKALEWASHLGVEGVSVVCSNINCTVFIPGHMPIAIVCGHWGPCYMPTGR